MKHLLKQTLLTGFLLAAALVCAHGNASASCSLTAPANFDELISAYNVFATSNSYTIPANTISFQCTSFESSVVVYFLGLSTTYGTYTAPYLSGPNGSELNFQLCTSSSACTSNFWTATTACGSCTFTNVVSNTTKTISTAIAVYVPTGQNLYVSSAGAYTGTVHFAFDCDSGGSC
jgi:hypothetical protein